MYCISYLRYARLDFHLFIYLFIYLFVYLFISLKQERDPFWEPDDAEVLIGSAHVYLQSLAYKVCLLAFNSKYLDALKLTLR